MPIIKCNSGTIQYTGSISSNGCIMIPLVSGSFLFLFLFLFLFSLYILAYVWIMDNVRLLEVLQVIPSFHSVELNGQYVQRQWDLPSLPVDEAKKLRSPATMNLKHGITVHTLMLPVVKIIFSCLEITVSFTV